MKWFGTKDHPFARICEPNDYTSTPVGAICVYCDEPIGPDDIGFVVPHVSIVEAESSNRAEHHECFMRQLTGSVGHQRRECACYGRVDHSESGLTRREAARRTRDYFSLRHT